LRSCDTLKTGNNPQKNLVGLQLEHRALQLLS
jgi:hypothetical protein